MLNDWHALGSVQYRKWHVYDMAWSPPGFTAAEGRPMSLENYQVCGAPFSGPVAVLTDPKKASANDSSKPMMLGIYSSSGIKISEIEWKNRSVLAMGWTDHEILVTILENGVMKMIDLYSRTIHELQLLDIGSTSNILECHFWGNGVACMTSDNSIRVAEGLAANDLVHNPPRLYSLRTSLGIDRTYTAMTIIPPLLSRSGFLEVLVGTSDRSVLVIHEHSNETIIEDQLLHSKLGASITKFSLGPDGRFIACYRKDGVLTVMAANFTSKVVDFDTKSASKPVAIEWCGKDSVIMQWRNTGLVMVGPFGDWINFPYDTAGVYLVPELDCCRILTATSCEVLQLVPAPTIAALEIGSMEPAALILDAMDAFDEGDPKSDENIRTIAAANQLHEAVIACIQAAAAEFFPPQQMRLLKAASYGKAFCPDMDPNEFVETAKKLRVLNEVRKPEIGLPLTVQQYNRLTPEVLVGRLTTRNQHFLALKICQLLRLKQDRVLIHWACEKVKKMATVTGTSDEEIRSAIKMQLATYGRVSFLSVAKVAYSIGRPRLATMLLDNEQQPDSQIPLLLEMNEEELALQKAINSEDTDLIYFTLINLEARVKPTKSSQDNFFRIIHNHAEAANLLKIYYRNKVNMNDRSILGNLLLHSKNYLEAGNAAVNQALQQPNTASKIQFLKEASQLYAQGRDCSLFRTMTDEYVELLDLQKSMELRANSRVTFVGQSLQETLQSLIRLGLEDQGEHRTWTEAEVTKLVKKFKVSEKMIYHIRIECISEREDWAALSRLATERKSPIGYRPFAVAGLKYGAPTSDIEKYIERITVQEDKYELYLEMKIYGKAADAAIKLRDAYRLQEVSRVCQDPQLERYIGDMMQKL